MPNEMAPLEAAEKLESLIDYAGDTLDDALGFNLRKTVDAAASYLRQLAAGEYKPVVHAHWIQKAMPLGMKYCECSSCNYGVDSITDYCPSCGALMGGKDDSHE